MQLKINTHFHSVLTTILPTGNNNYWHSGRSRILVSLSLIRIEYVRVAHVRIQQPEKKQKHTGKFLKMVKINQCCYATKSRYTQAHRQLFFPFPWWRIIKKTTEHTKGYRFHSYSTRNSIQNMNRWWCSGVGLHQSCHTDSFQFPQVSVVNCCCCVQCAYKMCSERKREKNIKHRKKQSMRFLLA